MFNLTPDQITIIPARDKVQLPEIDIASLVGGWLATQSELRKGNINIKANEEQILAGTATAPLTGTGIFFGKDGSDYEFRVGNPSGNYFHYDGTDIAFVGGSLTVGTNAWHVDSSGNMWWGSSSTYAGATIKISSAGSVNFTTGTFSGDIVTTSIKTAASGARIEIGVTNPNVIDVYSTSGHSNITGLDAELRLRMETTGGYVTLYAQNDADSAIEVLKADGDAGVTIGGNLPLNAFNIVINKTGTGATIPLSITNAGSHNTLYLYCSYTSSIVPLIYAVADGNSQQGLYLELANTSNIARGINVLHKGTGIPAVFVADDNADRVLPAVYISAVASQGAHLRLNSLGGNDPSDPATGDIWFDGSDLKIRIGTTTYTLDKTAV